MQLGIYAFIILGYSILSWGGTLGELPTGNGINLEIEAES